VLALIDSSCPDCHQQIAHERSLTGEPRALICPECGWEIQIQEMRDQLLVMEAGTLRNNPGLEEEMRKGWGPSRGSGAKQQGQSASPKPQRKD